MRSLAVFLGIGKLFVYLLQKSPIPRKLPEGLLVELFECDLCLGFWIYLFLGVILKYNIDEELESVLISKLATAGISAFVMHLITIGWREKFSTYIIE
jgi:hypothetical protein